MLSIFLVAFLKSFQILANSFKRLNLWQISKTANLNTQKSSILNWLSVYQHWSNNNNVRCTYDCIIKYQTTRS